MPSFIFRNILFAFIFILDSKDILSHENLKKQLLYKKEKIKSENYMCKHGEKGHEQ